MKRRHVAVVTESGNGHVFPVLPLCSELSRRGHYVTYATSNHYAKRISETGSKPVIFNSTPPGEKLRKDMQSFFSLPSADPRWWGVCREFQSHRFEYAEEVLLQLMRYYEKDVPDLILYDPLMVAGRILARNLNRTAIQVSPDFVPKKGFFFREDGVYKSPDPLFSAAHDSFLFKHGIVTENNLWHTESLNIHLLPREFQPGEDIYDERFCFVGALLDRPFEPIWKNNSNDDPIVLISDISGLRGAEMNSSSYYNFFIDALSKSKCHCILSIGDNIDPRSIGSLPENFSINRSASHLEILPFAALSIYHGGMLSSMEAIYNGVPLLALTENIFTAEVAYRVAELGLGVNLSRGALTPLRLGELVEGMLHDMELGNRVRQMQAVFRASGGAKLAADRIDAAFG